MKILKIAALTLALGASGTAMAADGPLGPTSSAQMNVSLTVIPNTDNYVQIVGLDDVVIGDFIEGQTGFSTFSNPGAQQYFCLNKNTPGTVNLSIAGSGPSQTLGNAYVNELTNGANKGEVRITLGNGAGIIAPTASGWNNLSADSPSTCSAASGTGHILTTLVGSTTPLVAGTYSNTFTLILSPN